MEITHNRRNYVVLQIRYMKFRQAGSKNSYEVGHANNGNGILTWHGGFSGKERDPDRGRYGDCQIDLMTGTLAAETALPEKMCAMSRAGIQRRSAAR